LNRGNGAVTINELITGVNITLGAVSADACTSFAQCCTSPSGTVVPAVCLVRAINNALHGCP
jgi:hypothetical protein